jgi:hypothetical protein
LNIFKQKLRHKLDIAREDSDFSYFFSLLVAGEAISKVITLISASALILDKDRHQYRILHGLVRASGIGDWSKALDDLLVGTASQHLIPEYREFQTELTKKTPDGEWQNIAVQELVKSLESLNVSIESINGKKDLKSWFKLFTELRNRTRGHGALLPGAASKSVPHLEKSIGLILDNLSLFSVPSAYLKRNLSGKYRVTEIGVASNKFDKYKASSDLAIEDGVYVFLGEPKKIPLLLSDPDLTDFYIANGSFSNKKYELISYITDDKKYGDSSEYLAPVGVLPPSESEGVGELQCIGSTFTNVPSLSYDYIQRQELEDQLYNLLLDDRRAVVTLLGRGGIGKTSLALKVIPRLYDEKRFDAIVWFSSRDIDLQASGAKLVTAEVVSSKDISLYYSKLVLSQSEIKVKNFNSIEYFQNQLVNSGVGPCLFVFDNFETTSNPIEIFKWIDTYIRPPNKILITTRLREFLGDYPISVHGMTEPESEDLITLTAKHLGVENHLSERLIEDIYKVSAGHPYIIKIMLGELSKNNMKGSLPKIIAGSDEVLTALFERTYSVLNPCAQRVFLTLSSWNSTVSRLALEAVLMSSIDDPLEVEKSIDTLVQYSLAEEFKSEIDEQYFISLPFTAMSFGDKKLKVSPLKNIITGDVRLLQKFGPTKLERKNISLDPHIKTFLSSLDNPIADYRTHKELLERIGLSYIPSLPIVSRWLEESGDIILLEEAKKYLYLYLEREVAEAKKSTAWKQLASVCSALKLPLEEVHALIESSQHSQVEFFDLSNVVNKVNHMLSTQQIVLENHDVKSDTLSRLYKVVNTRKSEGDAVDLSRIAWLALHLDKLDDAKSLTEQGLSIDPDNRFCQKLMLKLEKTPEYQ